MMPYAMYFCGFQDGIVFDGLTDVYNKIHMVSWLLFTEVTDVVSGDAYIN